MLASTIQSSPHLGRVSLARTSRPKLFTRLSVGLAGALTMVTLTSSAELAVANGTACTSAFSDFNPGTPTEVSDRLDLVDPGLAYESTTNPYEISAEEDLVWLSWVTTQATDRDLRDEALESSYRQTADLDLADCLFTPIGYQLVTGFGPTFDTKHPFTGIYDGSGNSLTGLSIEFSTTNRFAGLFGLVDGSAEFRNLEVEASVSTSNLVDTGGLIGLIDTGATVSVSQVKLTGDVSSTGVGSVGGLVGKAVTGADVDIELSSFVGTLSSPVNGASGGLVGTASGSTSIENSYARATHSGSSTSQAGFVGAGTGAGVVKSYAASAGTNNGAATSGLTTSSASFWDSELGPTNARSSDGDISGVEGKSTAEMKTMATYGPAPAGGSWKIVDGWEAVTDPVTNVWGLCQGVNGDYPFLLWEYGTDPCPDPETGDSGDSGDSGGSGASDGNEESDTVTASPPTTVVTPQRVAPIASPMPPEAVEGPVLSAGTVPEPPQLATVSLGGIPVALEQTVSDATTLSLAAGSVALDMIVVDGSGAQASEGITQLGVKNRSSVDIAGSGLLPGSTVQLFIPLTTEDSRKLAQLVVDADGSFSGSAALSADPLAAPLPIGRHLLQLVTVDEEGNQVVLEMTVSIEQADPNPELNREVGEVPALNLGSLQSTSAGLPVESTVTAVADQKLVVVEGNGWTMAVDIDSPDGAVEETEEGALVTLVRDEIALVSGSGFLGGTRADVWLFSEPTLLGTVTIDDNGEFRGEVDVDPAVIPAGEHTLQLQGVGSDGYIKAANLGVLVEDAGFIPSAVEESSFSWAFLWWLLPPFLVLLIVWGVLRRRSSASRA